MKTIIQGKNLKITYDVDNKLKTIKNDKGEEITVYTGKPELTKKTEITNWETIKEFDEKVEFNNEPNNTWTIAFSGRLGYINLSEDEVIGITKRITRIDLGAYVIHTDKVLSETEVLKEESEEILECQIKEFNKVMIESNERLLAYCNLHKLNPEETDVNELFKMVCPNQRYEIYNGKLVADGTVGINLNESALGGVYQLSQDNLTSATSICNGKITTSSLSLIVKLRR